MQWLGNVRYPPENVSDLSDQEWIAELRKQYHDRVCFFKPKDGGVPFHTAAEWLEKGMIGVYLKGER